MRAIDADALKRRAQKAATEAWKMKLTARVETTLNQFLDWINQAPTIEPERKKGKWIDGYRRQTCSLCKGKGVRSWRFCPYCGADMRGEQDD